MHVPCGSKWGCKCVCTVPCNGLASYSRCISKRFNQFSSQTDGNMGWFLRILKFWFCLIWFKMRTVRRSGVKCCKTDSRMRTERTEWQTRRTRVLTNIWFYAQKRKEICTKIKRLFVPASANYSLKILPKRINIKNNTYNKNNTLTYCRANQQQMKQKARSIWDSVRANSSKSHTILSWTGNEITGWYGTMILVHELDLTQVEGCLWRLGEPFQIAAELTSALG